MMGKFSGAYELQAFRILQIAFILLPIIAGVDKFFYFITDWTHYLSPSTLDFLQGNQEKFLMAVGVMEVLVGLGVIWRPYIFSYAVILWLLCIMINTLFLREYYDIILRDFGLVLSALALGKLSRKYSI